jgi:hypothetical protein
MSVFRAHEHNLTKEPIARFVPLAPRGTSGERAGERGFIRSPAFSPVNFVMHPLFVLGTKSTVSNNHIPQQILRVSIPINAPNFSILSARCPMPMAQ